MEDYIKLFNSLSEAHIYPIETIPFCGTVIRGGALSDVNITCNIVDKGIETKNNDAYLVDMVVIKNTWQEGRTNNIVRAVIRGDVVLNGKVDCYSITFEQGAHLTINGGARLRVWQGGITNNDCTNVNYLTIVEDAVNDSYGEFLLHPDVSMNNHPLSRIKFISNSWYDGTNHEKAFGPPTYSGVITNIETTSTERIFFDIWRGISWDYIGAFNVPGDPYINDNLQKFNIPFGLCALTTKNDINSKPTIDFIGNLMGNSEQTIHIYNNYTHISNAYLSNISIKLLYNFFKFNNYSEFYIVPADPATTIQVTDDNVDSFTYVNPMSCFEVKHSGTSSITLSYKDLVWDPSFEEEVTPTRSLMTSALTSPKPTEIDTTLEGTAIFDNPVPIFPPEHNDER